MTTLNHRSLGKAEFAMTLAQKKAIKAQQTANNAAAVWRAARKRMLDDISNTATKAKPAPPRTSTEAFAHKDPRHSLAVLDHVDFATGMYEHEYTNLQLVARKYLVRTLSEELCKDPSLPMYTSTRSSNMMATATVRYLFDVACELATKDPETYGAAKGELDWHKPQTVLKGRETRGAGVVAFSDDAMELLKTAFVTAKARVQENVDFTSKYATAMHATATAAVAESEAP
jgi:hypothetical protein